MLKKLIIVADDFTGANDTGVQFRKSGLKVNVIIDSDRLKEEADECDVLVIDLESRMDLSQTSYNKCFSLGKQILESGEVLVYKKLDSTFRGNIGAEIDGLMDGLNIKIAFLAPAFPSCGRTTENGIVFVNGIKLTETEYSCDPRTPVKDSRIAQIIGRQSSRVCNEITSDIFESNIKNDPSGLMKRIKEGAEIFIFDSRTETDLENIACMIEKFTDMPFLLAGSAGLAGHLNHSSLFRPKPLCFVFSGSVNEISLKQISHSKNEGNCRVIPIAALDLLDDKLIFDDIVASVNESVSDGIRRFIFCTALSREDVDNVFRVVELRSLSRPLTAQKISDSLGHLAADLINSFHPSGVLLTGGETSFSTVNALKASGLSIEMEILQGIQCGRLRGCNVKSLIATKSGGFGKVDAISKTFEFFKI
jgi:uncharacterized protein YgbK (DUF1537 family)